MNEGKELLFKVIDNELDRVSKYNMNDLVIGKVNLINLLSKIEEDENNFYMVTDEIIDRIIESNDIKQASFRKNALKARDLLIGKKSYKLKITLDKELTGAINTFKKNLNKYINDKTPNGIDVEEYRDKLKSIKKNTNSNKLVKDFDFIAEITKKYDEISYEHNMYIILKYINEHNLSIIKAPKINPPLFDIKLIIKPRLDEKIIEILDKMGLNPKDLPNYLLSEFKKCDANQVYETYNLVRKNKAEDYGIFHLISKENLLARLVLLLYATPDSVKNVVDGIKDSKGNIDINLLKVLTNECIPCFLVEQNQFFEPKNMEYTKLISLLKESGVNYRALIAKNPLFMIADYDVLDYVLKYMEMSGANKKTVINKCYKTLATNPALIIDNLMVLKKYNINIEEYLKNPNYTLLKVTNLENKIEYILSRTSSLNRDNLDCELLNKLLITRVYRASLGEKITWRN